jgi:hypothetical protein
MNREVRANNKLGTSRRLERIAERAASCFVLFTEYQQGDQINM